MPGSQEIGDGAKMTLISDSGYWCHIGTLGGVCLFENKFIRVFEYP